jgi:hypothetical protein
MSSTPNLPVMPVIPAKSTVGVNFERGVPARGEAEPSSSPACMDGRRVTGWLWLSPHPIDLIPYNSSGYADGRGL